MSRRRVVITGLGCVTALAENPQGLFDALLEGKSGISLIEHFDTSTYPVRIGGEIKNFDVSKYVDSREGKRMDLFSQYAVAAAAQAIEDSRLDFKKEDLYKISVIVGTGIGGIQEIEQQHKRLLDKGVRKVSPFTVPRLMANAASGNIAIQHGLKGPNIAVSSACASGTHAIGEAFCNILAGRSDVSITGGTEAALSPIGLTSFCAARSLSTRNDDPQHASRPFDRDRDGFVMADGAAIIVLEEYEHAKNRGAKIYAELLGYGATDDGFHITQPMPDGQGAAKAMERAIRDANIKPQQVDYINAHGTGTLLNDVAECAAIKQVFGDHVNKLKVSSTKSCLGHSLGATGAIEMLICAKVITDSVIPPTTNLDNIDAKCDSNIDFVPHKPKEQKVNFVLSNSFGFGGHNACLVIAKV